MSRGADFIAALKPASFRGVRFGVTASRKVFGRNTATHTYPFRDVVWIEDLGRKGRQITITGFLVANSLIYGGGDVISQQQALIAAAETAGSGKLVHPTLGALTVSVTGDLSLNESLDDGGVIEFEMTVTEAGQKIFPSADTKNTAAVTTAAATADAGAATDASNALTPALSEGALAPTTAAAATGTWGQQLTAFGQDATNLNSLASQLAGNFGRYFNGRNVGGLVLGLATGLDPTGTVSQLAQLAAGARAVIGVAVSDVNLVAANLGLGSSNNSAADLAAATQAAVAAAVASAADPADAIRLLSGLAQGVPSVGATATPVGQAVGDLFRRAAVVALARAGTAYQPASYDDANAVRGTIASALDAEILVAGNEGDDATFAALRALRVAVVQDLTARGATLAPIVTVLTPLPLPADVLAQRLYRDPTRADQLVVEANPINPLFMPTSFQALAA